MRELESADHDHPLKLDLKLNKVQNDSHEQTQGLKEITKDLDSVALDWKTLRNIKECGCSTPFDHFSRKVFSFFI